MNQKIKQIEWAIQNANLFKSKLTEDALKVPFMGSLKIRHLLNNLGAISTRYFEVGSHKGGSFCSTISGNYNLLSAVCCDNFSEFNEEQGLKQQLIANALDHISNKTMFHLLDEDCFGIDPKRIPHPIDLYLFDGNHSFESQRDGVKHFVTAMADEFILCVDDWTFPGVAEGTQIGIQESGLKVLSTHIMVTPEEGLPNDHWWNGFACFLMSKI